MQMFSPRPSMEKLGSKYGSVKVRYWLKEILIQILLPVVEKKEQKAGRGNVVPTLVTGVRVEIVAVKGEAVEAEVTDVVAEARAVETVVAEAEEGNFTTSSNYQIIKLSN